MKEATGELNMTVVTVVAIAAVAAFFYAFVWPGIQRSIEASTYCSMATGCDENYKNCQYTDEDGEEHTDLDCSSYYADLLDEEQHVVLKLEVERNERGNRGT